MSGFELLKKVRIEAFRRRRYLTAHDALDYKEADTKLERTIIWPSRSVPAKLEYRAEALFAADQYCPTTN